uniref:Uncharacterized protein n=1 Tax=Brassica oleracea TaxID=3712 RepID=A0A3P6EVH8_BRAOL|nr:unnamed protein product [Brassica oleracea]
MFVHVLLVMKQATNLMKIFAYVEEKRKTRSTKDISGDTSVGPLGEGKYNFIVQYSDKKEEPRQQIMMINPDEFPPQEDFLKNNISHCPKIISQAVDSSGPSQLGQAEKVLNWQIENSLAQNQLLSIINHKVDQLAEGYNSRLLSLQNSITEIHGRLSMPRKYDS